MNVQKHADDGNWSRSAAIERSFTTAVFFFKHSETCGTSAYAREEVLTLLADTDSSQPGVPR